MVDERWRVRLSSGAEPDGPAGVASCWPSDAEWLVTTRLPLR